MSRWYRASSLALPTTIMTETASYRIPAHGARCFIGQKFGRKYRPDISVFGQQLVATTIGTQHIFEMRLGV
jgi:hypothetical protein